MGSVMEAYCVKCKTKREMLDPQPVFTANGVPATAGRCPVCGTVYSGDPYDAVIVGRSHNRLSSAVRALGLAYRVTGRAEFARRAEEILVGYADRYRSYPRHDINGKDDVRGGRIDTTSQRG